MVLFISELYCAAVFIHPPPHNEDQNIKDEENMKKLPAKACCHSGSWKDKGKPTQKKYED